MPKSPPWSTPAVSGRGTGHLSACDANALPMRIGSLSHGCQQCCPAPGLGSYVPGPTSREHGLSAPGCLPVASPRCGVRLLKTQRALPATDMAERNDTQEGVWVGDEMR